MPPLSLPPLIMGGAGFSYQLHPSPATLPIVDILQRAFALGIHTIDTSPYYHPSEELLGTALSDPAITSTHPRHTYQLMTKCGRLSATQFDYSPTWIRASVARSLQRFHTTYLDVVFCHDIEFVSLIDAVLAVGTLLELKAAGQVRHVGISGYDLPRLVAVAQAVLARYDQPVDVVQNWAQLSLQNTRLIEHLDSLRAAGVGAVCNASPLASGLLRKGGVPVGQLGDWHPAPEGLRAAAQQAARWVEEEKEQEGRQSLAAVAMQYAVVQSLRSSGPGFAVSTIMGISTLEDLEQNVAAVGRVLKLKGEGGREGEGGAGGGLGLLGRNALNEESAAATEPLFQGVRRILGKWVDYDFSSPAPSTVSAPVEEAEIVVLPVNGNIEGHTQTEIAV